MLAVEESRTTPHLAHSRMFSFVFLNPVADYYREAIAKDRDEHSYLGPVWLDTNTY